MHTIQMMAWQVLAQVEEYADFPAEEFVEPVREMSYLAWMYSALGPFYLLGLPSLGLFAFVAAILVVVKNRRPADISSSIYFAAAPLLLGIFGVVHGMIASMQVIAMSGAAPKASHIAMGVSTSLFSALVGLMCSFPAYGVLAIGYLVRTLMLKGPPSSAKMIE
jgi:hypothetical protein